MRMIGKLAFGTGAVVLTLLVFLGQLHAFGNLHAVVPGEVYRAAQLTPAQIDADRKKLGIRSILNLRGAAPDAPWYEAELAASAAQGIVHADFAMSASQQIDPEQAQALIAVMRDLPKPLLIHCQHGSDRTGLAAALYLVAVHGMDEETAEWQLSLWYGHFSVPYLSAAFPMDQSWERMEVVLGLDHT